MIKPMLFIFSGQTLAMSSTSRCTIGLPAIGKSGFAVVNVCGRRRLPKPAMGMIMFIDESIVQVNLIKNLCGRRPNTFSFNE